MSRSPSQEIREGDEVAFLSRHFVALTCLYELTSANGTRSHHALAIPGFLVEMHHFYFWVTAGHWLRELDELLAKKGVKVHGASFMDSFAHGAVHKDPIPFRYETGCGYYLDQPENALDFALIPLDGLQIRAFVANNLIPISRENWVRQRGLTFDFYMILGIPADKVITNLDNHGMMGVSVSQSLVRVERIGLDDLGETPSDAGAAPTDAWFIGRLPPGCKIRDLKGMSGGPIYGFRRGGKGGLTYHVVALQSRWWDKSRTVFGCSVPLFAEQVYQRFGALLAKTSTRKKKRADRGI